MQVTASAWVNDFREQIERTRILRTVYRSVTALGSRLQSLANLSRATLPYSTLMVTRAARTGVAGAGMIWRPVSSGTQVIESLFKISRVVTFSLNFKGTHCDFGILRSPSLEDTCHNVYCLQFMHSIMTY